MLRSCRIRKHPFRIIDVDRRTVALVRTLIPPGILQFHGVHPDRCNFLGGITVKITVEHIDTLNIICREKHVHKTLLDRLIDRRINRERIRGSQRRLHIIIKIDHIGKLLHILKNNGKIPL